MLTFRVSALVSSILLTAACGTNAKQTPTPTSLEPATPTSTKTPEDPKLPLDPAVTFGKLDNGLTYYVRKHHKPENRAQLWLAVNAGSMQEDDDQRGLAHFVEHMAFNGTKKFKKHEIVNYLEGIGVRFGPDLNAYTSFDETVYMLQVPTDDAKAVETGLQILREWASHIAFEDEEIEKERGVVIEEWRLGRGARMRTFDKQWPTLVKGSHYAKRMVIGTKEILESAPPDTLRKYYRDWYRPELMAVVAVGDFDHTAIQSRIKTLFGDMKSPETPRERVSHPVPDHAETLITIATDKELTDTRIAVIQKLDKRPTGTAANYRTFVVERLYHNMLNDRLRELQEQADPPFVSGFSVPVNYVRTKHMIFQGAQVKQGQLERGLAALVTEIERVDRHGFTNTELDRAKRSLLREYQSSAKERDKVRARSLASEIVRHHFTGESMPGIEHELALVTKQLPTISLAEINRIARDWIHEKNRVISISAPQGTALPNKQQLLTLISKTRKQEIAAYKDEVTAEPLIAKRPVAGTVVSESTDKALGTTTLKLSNGVTVVVKPTQFKNDQIVLNAFSPGGLSLASDQNYPSAKYAAQIMRASGVGAFTAAKLRKALAGKVVSGRVWINELQEGMSGQSSPQDFETMLQLVHLAFTAPRADHEAFESWRTRKLEEVKNRLASPQTVFRDRFESEFSKNHPRRQPPTVAGINQVKLDKAFAFYKDRFKDAGDFTFVLVGNVSPADAKPLLLTYLGSLPSQSREESHRNIGIKYPVRVKKFTAKKGIEPKSSVRIQFTGRKKWSRQALHDITSLSRALRIRLRETLREDMGGVYGVGVWGWISRQPTERYHFGITFGCAPENVDKLIAAVFEEIKAIQKGGVADSYIEKIKNGQTRQRETALKQNRFWQRQLSFHYEHKLDPKSILEYAKLVDSVSSRRIKNAAREYLNRKRYVQGILYPAGK